MANQEETDIRAGEAHLAYQQGLSGQPYVGPDEDAYRAGRAEARRLSDLRHHDWRDQLNHMRFW